MKFPKPEPYRVKKTRERRKKHEARRACCDVVWARADHRCELCRAPVMRCGSSPFTLGHVHERVPRSHGGDPTDPTNCQLLCFHCHNSGPSGAHRVTPNWRTKT